MNNNNSTTELEHRTLNYHLVPSRDREELKKRVREYEPRSIDWVSHIRDAGTPAYPTPKVASSWSCCEYNEHETYWTLVEMCDEEKASIGALTQRIATQTRLTQAEAYEAVTAGILVGEIGRTATLIYCPRDVAEAYEWSWY